MAAGIALAGAAQAQTCAVDGVTAIATGTCTIPANVHFVRVTVAGAGGGGGGADGAGYPLPAIPPATSPTAVGGNGGKGGSGAQISATIRTAPNALLSSTAGVGGELGRSPNSNNVPSTSVCATNNVAAGGSGTGAGGKGGVQQSCPQGYSGGGGAGGGSTGLTLNGVALQAGGGGGGGGGSAGQPGADGASGTSASSPVLTALSTCAQGQAGINGINTASSLSGGGGGGGGGGAVGGAGGIAGKDASTSSSAPTAGIQSGGGNVGSTCYFDGSNSGALVAAPTAINNGGLGGLGSTNRATLNGTATAGGNGSITMKALPALTLNVHWAANAYPADTFSASTSGGSNNPAINNAAASAGDQSSVPALAASGNVITFAAPSISSSNAANYRATLACTGNANPLQGSAFPYQLTLTDADTNVVCTYTNTIVAADIAVSKSVDKATPHVGDQVSFIVTALNKGPADAPAVQITDNLPAGLTLVSATPSQGSYDVSTGIWSVGTIVYNATTPASATLTVVATVTQAGPLTNTATRTDNVYPDPDTSNNAGSASINSAASADVRISKTVDNAKPNLNTNATFTVTVRNAGPSNATNVSVNDLLPAGLVFVSATPSVGTYNAGTGVWSVGPLAANVNAAQTLALVAKVTQTNDVTNTATVTATEFDPNTSNNSSGVVVNGQSADLQVVKTVDNNAPLLGDNVQFTITATNLGPDVATNIVVTDALPAGLTFVSASSTDYDAATGKWTLPQLTASGTTASASLTVTAKVARTGTIVNTASAKGDQTDPTPGNDNGSANVTVPASVDVSITKTGAANVAAEGDISYILTISNAGPDVATNASYSDSVPVSITGVAASCGGELLGAVCATPTVSANVVSGTLPTLPSGASAVITITGKAPAVASTLSNTASVTPPTGSNDTNSGNNTSAPVTTTVAAPVADLSASISGPASAVAGGTVSYAVTATNAGPNAALDAALTLPTPSGLVFVSATGVCSGGMPCALGTLASGQSVTITVTYTVQSGFVGSIVNTASANSSVSDPNSTNNSASATTTVAATGPTDPTNPTNPTNPGATTPVPVDAGWMLVLLSLALGVVVWRNKNFLTQYRS